MFSPNKKTSDNKKLITLKNKEIIDVIIEDMAKAGKSTSSAVIEQIILRDLFGESKESEKYIRYIYSEGLKNTFIYLMQELAAGSGWQASHPNAKRLVEFMLDVLSLQRPKRGQEFKDEQMYEHLLSNCTMLVEKLKLDYNDKELFALDKFVYDSDIHFLNNLKFADYVPYNFIHLILKYWDSLGNYTFSYRVLYDIVEMSDEKTWETSQNRVLAAECIKNVVKEWDNE